MNIGAGLHAKGTNVLVAKSIPDIEGQVYRFGGEPGSFRHVDRSSTYGYSYISFRINDPAFGLVETRIPLQPYTPQNERERQRMYRTAFAYIKGTLAAIADGLIVPSRGFGDFIVGDDGKTYFERETRPFLLAKHVKTNGEKALPKAKEVACRYCGKVNRMRHDKDITEATCGHCHKPLASNSPWNSR
jgi:hypothetical protein